MQKREALLVADGSSQTRSFISELFIDKYEILEAKNGFEALDILKKNYKDIVIAVLDIVMPECDGFIVAKKMSEDPDLFRIPVIYTTAANCIEYENYGYELGNSDVILKSMFIPHVVKKHIENIIELYRYKNNLEEIVRDQSRVLTLQTNKIREMNDFVIEALSTVVEFRNLESGEHIRRIKTFTNILLNNLAGGSNYYDLDIYQINNITSASAMHDIGKIAIPDSILLKPGRLTEDEFEVIKTHTTKGCEILTNLTLIDDPEFNNLCYTICRYHHERWDGRGYPDKLKGDEIPISAQVVSIADVYDALVSERVYKKPIKHEDAIKMITAGECGSFSPALLDNLISVEEQFKEYTIQSGAYKPVNS